MKKGVWNVENPLALSELFSDGVFLVPISGDEGAVNTESASAEPESQQITSEKSNDINAEIPNSILNNKPESQEISQLGSKNTAVLNSNEANSPPPINPVTQSSNTAPNTEYSNSVPVTQSSNTVPNTESSNAIPNAPNEGTLNPAPPVNVKLPNWEGVYIVNLIYEENQFEPMDVIKKIMQAVRIPNVEINGQTVKFIPISKGSTSLTPELLEQYLQHFTQVRILFWIKNSRLESNFLQLNHPRILMVDMPSVMVSSDDKKRNNWSTIKTFFGM